MALADDTQSGGNRWLVSVLVPVLNEERHLPEALVTMLSQQLDGDEAEFIFADGGSVDATARLLSEAASRDPRVRVFHNPGRTTARGLNLALAHARGDYIARMDAHTAYSPDYLLTGVRRLRAGGVAWVSGPQLPVGRGRVSEVVTLALGSFAGTGGVAYRTMTEGEVEVASGFTGVWTAETLRRFGGWDESWLSNEDGELGGRLRRTGARIVCLPEMAAEYIPRDSLRALARQYFRYGQYKTKTVLRYQEVLRPPHVIPPAIVAVGASAAFGPRRVRRPARALLAAYFMTLATTAVRAARNAPIARAAQVPAALFVMHSAWGIGVYVGLTRFLRPGRRHCPPPIDAS